MSGETGQRLPPDRCRRPIPAPGLREAPPSDPGEGEVSSAQTLDVAVDCTIIDIDVLAIRCIHQLVAVFDVPWTVRQRFEDQELGHGKLDRFTFPGAQVPRRVEYQVPTHDYRLALRIVALAGELAAADQRPDALDQQPLREGLLDVIVGTHAQTEKLVDFIILRS